LTFSKASAVTGGPGRWRAELAEGWDIFGISNGGYLLSIMTRAMAEEADGREPISVTGHFLNPATPGPVDIDVETLKKGRGLSAMRSTMSGADKPLLVATAVFASHERGRHRSELVLPAPPDIPDPRECVLAEPSNSAPFPPPFTGKVEVRIHPEDAAALLGEKTGKPNMRGWFRLRHHEPLDAFAVILASDAFPPAIFNTELPLGWTPTIDLTVQIRQPRPVGWLRCRFRTRFITDGMLEEDGEIWDENGRPVALSRQLALVPH